MARLFDERHYVRFVLRIGVGNLSQSSVPSPVELTTRFEDRCSFRLQPNFRGLRKPIFAGALGPTPIR